MSTHSCHTNSAKLQFNSFSHCLSPTAEMLSFLSASIGRMRRPVHSFHSKWYPTTRKSIETENRYSGSPICWSEWINHHNPISLNIWCCNRQGSNWNWRCHRKTKLRIRKRSWPAIKDHFKANDDEYLDRNWLINLSRYYGCYDFYRQQLTQMKVLTNSVCHCSSGKFIWPAEKIEMKINSRPQKKLLWRCTIKVLRVLIYRLIDQINVWEKTNHIFNENSEQHSNTIQQIDEAKSSWMGRTSFKIIEEEWNFPKWAANASLQQHT